MAMDHRQQEAHYDVLVRLIFGLVQSKAGQPLEAVDAWRNDSQTLARKLFQHLISLRALCCVHRVEIAPHPQFDFIDHSTAAVIARSVLETYLVFHFIYGGADPSLSEFRHKIWKYGGLAERQKLQGLGETAVAEKARDKTEMDQLKPEIQASPHFTAHTEKAREFIMKGEWRGGKGWPDLAVAAGFHEQYFRNIYKHLCGYSHASYISAMQVGQAQEIQIQRGLAGMYVGVGLVVMSHFARTYTALYPETAPILAADEEGKAVIDCWYFTAEDWENVVVSQART